MYHHKTAIIIIKIPINNFFFASEGIHHLLPPRLHRISSLNTKLLSENGGRERIIDYQSMMETSKSLGKVLSLSLRFHLKLTIAGDR